VERGNRKRREEVESAETQLGDTKTYPAGYLTQKVERAGKLHILQVLKTSLLKQK